MKLTMMRGLPGSGKSTTAKETVVKSGQAGRINRDDLRAMIFDSVWSGPREKVIVECEKAIAQVLIKNKMTPIIDDTNLQKSHEDMWRWFCNENNVAFDMNDTKTDIATCIERDSKRPKPVGEAIINRMALDAGMIDFGEKPIIICDLDGTVCDGEHREHYVTIGNGRTKKDWDGYFTEMVYDKPIDTIIDWVNELSKEYTICIVSGRPDTYQLETLYWLHYVGKMHFDHIFMRRGNDKRPDVDVKNDILAKLPKSQILFAIDDRPIVIRETWRKNGVMVIPVCGECEEF
jgi:predicted kinase